MYHLTCFFRSESKTEGSTTDATALSGFLLCCSSSLYLCCTMRLSEMPIFFFFEHIGIEPIEPWLATKLYIGPPPPLLLLHCSPPAPRASGFVAETVSPPSLSPPVPDEPDTVGAVPAWWPALGPSKPDTFGAVPAWWPALGPGEPDTVGAVPAWWPRLTPPSLPPALLPLPSPSISFLSLASLTSLRWAFAQVQQMPVLPTSVLFFGARRLFALRYFAKSFM